MGPLQLFGGVSGDLEEALVPAQEAALLVVEIEDSRQALEEKRRSRRADSSAARRSRSRSCPSSATERSVAASSRSAISRSRKKPTSVE
jgi:hypothetical protein